MPSYLLTTLHPITQSTQYKILGEFPGQSASLTSSYSAKAAREQLAEQYRDYLNNCTTVETWGEHRGLTIGESHTLLAVCKSCHENPHPET
jgi:hypothetical protein